MLPKYPSHCSGKPISATHYISELICLKRADSLNVDLPKDFIKIPQWKQYFGYQLKFAAKLVREFERKYIIKAIKNSKCFSLNNPFIRKDIQKYMKKHTTPVIKKEYNRIQQPTFRQPVSNSKLSELY